MEPHFLQLDIGDNILSITKWSNVCEHFYKMSIFWKCGGPCSISILLSTHILPENKVVHESGCPLRVYISLVPLYLNGTLKSSMRSGRRGGHFQDQVIKKQCVLSVITCPACQQNTKYSWDLCNDRAILWKDPGSLSYHSRSTIYLAGSDHIGLCKKKVISNF